MSVGRRHHGQASHGEVLSPRLGRRGPGDRADSAAAVLGSGRHRERVLRSPLEAGPAGSPRARGARLGGDDATLCTGPRAVCGGRSRRRPLDPALRAHGRQRALRGPVPAAGRAGRSGRESTERTPSEPGGLWWSRRESNPPRNGGTPSISGRLAHGLPFLRCSSTPAPVSHECHQTGTRSVVLVVTA